MSASRWSRLVAVTFRPGVRIAHRRRIHPCERSLGRRSRRWACHGTRRPRWRGPAEPGSRPGAGPSTGRAVRGPPVDGVPPLRRPVRVLLRRPAARVPTGADRPALGRRSGVGTAPGGLSAGPVRAGHPRCDSSRRGSMSAAPRTHEGPPSPARGMTAFIAEYTTFAWSMCRALVTARGARPAVTHRPSSRRMIQRSRWPLWAVVGAARWKPAPSNSSTVPTYPDIRSTRVPPVSTG